MSEQSMEKSAVNPLLQIDTCFRTYLNAYTRSCQNHIVDGSLDYAFESDFAVRQKIVGLNGWNKLFKVIDTMDMAEETKFLFMNCNQAGPLKFPEVYDSVKKCSERLELNPPIAFVINDTDREFIYSVSSNLSEPCIVISKKLAEMCNDEQLNLLIGCECGRIQNNHSVYNRAFTYLNYNQYAYKPKIHHYHHPVGRAVYTALEKWVAYGDITAYRAGIICLDNPGRFLDIICSLYAKGYVDFYGRQQRLIDFDRINNQSEYFHSQASRNLVSDMTITELERGFLAANEFLNCATLYSWREDLPCEKQHMDLGQICDVRTGVILGNGGRW